MNRRTHARSGLFLMEMVLALLFFSVCAAVCLRLFASAKTMTADSARLDGAVLAAESAAESWKAAGGDGEAAAALLGAKAAGDGTISIACDKDWRPAAGGNEAAYLVTVTPGPADGALRTATVRVDAAAGETIYTLTVKTAGGERP